MRYFSASLPGFLSADDALPTDAVALSDDDYAALMAGQAAGAPILIDTDGRPTLADTPPPTLEAVKAAAVERINREAGDERARYITVTTGQSATYIEKQKEAERYAAGSDGPFYYLEAEAEATGDTVEAVAALVLETADAWTRLNAAIEGKRRGALVAVDKATTAEEVEAIFPVAWPG